MNRRNFDQKKLWNKPKNTQITKRVTSFRTNTKLQNQNQPKKNVDNEVGAQSFFASLTKSYQDIKDLFYQKNWFRQFNYTLVQTSFANIINSSIYFLIISSIIIFFSYLAFFDQSFIIRSYNIQFQDNSYLNQTQVRKLVQKFHQGKLYGFIPNNQYFFLNSINLTTSAKQVFPEIQEVKVKERIWPNQATLEVVLTPTNITLGVKENNQNKFWRVSKQGKIISEDKAGIWQNLVTVDRPYSLYQQNGTNINQKTTLQNHTFQNQEEQLQRFDLTKKLANILESNGVKVVAVNYPSLVDTDIVFTTDRDAKILFDATAFDSKHIENRLLKFLETDNGGSLFSRHLIEGKMNYVDMRIPGKLFFCRKDKVCN